MCGSPVEGLSFFRSEQQPKEAKYPFIQLQVQPFLPGNDPSDLHRVKEIFNYEDKVSKLIHYSTIKLTDGPDFLTAF